MSAAETGSWSAARPTVGPPGELSQPNRCRSTSGSSHMAWGGVLKTRATSIASAAAVMLLLVAVPVTLVRLARWPSPGVSWTSALRGWVEKPLSGGFLAGVVYVAAWLLWGLLAAAVTTRLYAHAARMSRRLPRFRVPGPLQGLTAAVLGATAVSAAASAAPAHAAAPVVAAGEEATRPVLSAPPITAVGAVGESTTSSRATGDGERDTYTVRRGDTLSSIAQGCLGDADRWPEIFAANRGVRFPVGGTLRDPDLIYPGWALRIPDTVKAPGPAAMPPARQGPPPTPADQAPPASSSDPAGQAGDDGVVNPAPPPMTTPGAARISSESSAMPGPQDDAGERPAATSRPTWGVSLGTGGWLDMGLVAAMLAAVALVWAHRRRRYIPQPPTPEPRLDHPTVAPMPHVITDIRRGLRRAGTGSTRRRSGDPQPDGSIITQVGEDSPADGDDTGGLVVPGPAAATPARPPIAQWSPTGLGLTGPGAAAAARGILLSALAAGGLEDPHERGQVVIPSHTLAALLGSTAAVPVIPRLTVTAGLSEALALLEEQTLHRTRVCADHEVDSVGALRDTDPMAEPLPPLLLIADPTAAYECVRVAALLSQGQHLDIHGVLLGDWPDGDTVTVCDDGTTSPADRAGHDHHLTTGRLTVVDPTEASGLLRVIAESHTGEPPPPAPTQSVPPPDTETFRIRRHSADGDGIPPSPDARQPVQGPAPVVIAPATAVDVRPAAATSGEADLAGSDESAADGPRESDDSGGGAGRVEVRVLGDARIVDMDGTVPLRAKALELLVYLVVNDGDAAQENILDDLLPDAPAAKAPHRLHTYVSALRGALTRTGGPASYVTHPSRRYTLNREALDADLWRMRDALRSAERAGNDADRVASLRRAVDAYGGGLADGFDYEWVEAHREGIRRQALDAHLALAAATADPQEALAVLETAMRHDPYAEHVYQQAMRVRAALGHLDEIRALRRALTHRLHEIDADPSEDTMRLADQLIAGLRQRRPAGRPHPIGGRRP
ncbi:BTAD domain-containing putative transcriptional regulator [Micromonospora musae]|uniref:BTAD domain-containing putative transcriptional regulator n=1 Tax=Micromonospora musae TaxID=1894970 RepID=UPI003420FC50